MGNTVDKPKLYSFDSTASNVEFILHKESVLTAFYAELTSCAIIQPVMKQHSIPCALLCSDIREDSVIQKPQMKYLAKCMNEYSDDDDDDEDDKGKVIMTNAESTKVQKVCEKCIAVHENKEQLLNITSTSITIGGSSNNNSSKKVNVLELPKGICYKKKSISPKRVGKDSNNATLQKQTINSSLASTKNTSLNSSPTKNVNTHTQHYVMRKSNMNTIKQSVQQQQQQSCGGGKQMNTKVLNIGAVGNVNVHRRCTSPQVNKHSGGGYNTKEDSSYVAIKKQQQRKLSGNALNNSNNSNKGKSIKVSKCKSKSPKKMMKIEVKMDNTAKRKCSAKRKAQVKKVFELDLSDFGEDAYECSSNKSTVVDNQQQQQLNRRSNNVYNTASKLEKLKKLQQQRMNSKNTSSNNSKQFQLPSKVSNDVTSQQSIPINYYECDSISISDYLTNNNNQQQDSSNVTQNEVNNANNNNNGTPTSIFSFKKKIHPSVHKEVTSTFKVNAKLSDTEFKDIEFLN